MNGSGDMPGDRQQRADGWASRGNPGLFAAVLVPALLFLALYLPVLDHEFVWMDKTEIQQGTLILPAGEYLTAFARPLHITRGYVVEGYRNPYYRPFQLLLASNLYHAFGPDPRYFHAASLLLGALGVALFAGFVWMLSRQTALALLAGSIVAVHPAGLEAVAWISAVSEPMSAVFIIAGLMGAVMCMRTDVNRRATLFGILSWFLLVAGLFSKEKSVVMPALLLATLLSMLATKSHRHPGEGEKATLRRRGAWLLLIHGFTVAVYLLVLRPMVIGESLGAGPLIGGSRATHWMSALANWPGAIGWLFVPLRSTTSDVVRVVQSAADWWFWGGVTLAGGSLLAWWLLLRRGLGLAALGLAWIWIAYLPTANLVPMIHARADRYLFLSVFGLGLLIAGILPAFIRWAMPRRAALGLIIVASLIVGGLAQRTWARLPDWHSTRELFAIDVALEPSFREGRFHLARELFAERRYAEADRQLEILIRDVEDFPGRYSNINVAGAYQLGCFAKLARRKFAQAEAIAQRIAQRSPVLGNHPGIRDCLAQALEAQGRSRDALAVYLSIARGLTGDPPPGVSLAIARTYATLGQPAKARKWLRQAVANRGGNPKFDREIRKLRARIQRPSE